MIFFFLNVKKINKKMNNNSFGYNYNNNQNIIENINIINNFPLERPKFANPFLNPNNLKYPSFDNDDSPQKNFFDNNKTNNINYSNQNRINLNNNNNGNNNFFNPNQINNDNNNANNSNNINNNINNKLIINNDIDYNSYFIVNKDSFSKKEDFEIINDSFSDNLIRTMSVLNSTKKTTWKDNIKSFVSTLYYNNHNFSIKLDKESIRFPIFIFDRKIEKVIRDEIKYPLNSFLYMSYKSGFNNLSNVGCDNYTSDCGWGCMLRCCQMLLSKALIQKKIFDFFTEGKYPLMDVNIMTRIRKEVLDLFNDNYIPVELIRDSKQYSHFWHLYETFAKSNPLYNSITEIIPPYSIHILSKFGNCAGVYTSDQKMIKIICKINSAIFNTLSFVHFDSGAISKQKLLKTFCEECTNFSEEKGLITFNGIDYKFKKSGIIFISMRLGLTNLDESYYNLIPLIFKKIRHNFGLVGGRNNRAYYFIGIQNDNKLIFSDPHLNQEITGNLLKDYEKYYNENLYLMDIKEMSSSFSFAVGIFNQNHLMNFFEDIDWFEKSEFKDCIYYLK